MRTFKKQDPDGLMKSRLCGSDTASPSPVVTTWGGDRKGGLSRSGETKQYQLCCIHAEVLEEHQLAARAPVSGVSAEYQPLLRRPVDRDVRES